MTRHILLKIAAMTIAASAWLGVMFVVLQRPGFERGAAVAGLFVAQSLLALAVANGRLFIRGEEHLFCIGKPNSQK